MVIWTDAELLAFKPPEALSVSEWADKNRVLAAVSSAEPGQWSTDRNPPMRDIMDAVSDPGVEQVVIVKSTQIGGSEALLNCLGYAIDQDPGPAMVVLPRDEDAVNFMAMRIKPMIESSPALRKHVTGWAADLKKKTFQTSRMIMTIASAGSAAELASKPVRYLFLDEVDKYPPFAGREADPVSLAIERTRTFWNRKIVLDSTPTIRDAYVWQQFELSDQRLYHVPCPHCGEFQTLEFSNIKWPDDERNPEIITRDRLAYYECPHCKEEISDESKHGMLRRGMWVANGQKIEDGELVGEAEESAIRGFRIWCTYSPWLTFSEIAAEFLRSRDKPAKLMNFVNSWLAWVWEEQAEKLDPDIVARQVLDYREGTVPDGVLILTAGVDVQGERHGFWYTIRGWGLGEESWLIQAGHCETWEDVIRITMMGQYPSVDGSKTHGVSLTCIDSGYRTDEVYRVCRERLEVARPTKGKADLGGIPMKATRVDRDVTGSSIKGGVMLWLVDTNHYKTKLTRFQATSSGAGAWHLHRDVSRDYLGQVTSEHKVLERAPRSGAVKTTWKVKPGGGMNHLFDCEVLAAVAADMRGIYTLHNTSQAPATGQVKTKRKKNGRGWWKS